MIIHCFANKGLGKIYKMKNKSLITFLNFLYNQYYFNLIIFIFNLLTKLNFYFEQNLVITFMQLKFNLDS